MEKRTFTNRLANEWQRSPRWSGIERPYSPDDVWRLMGSYHIEHTLASWSSKCTPATPASIMAFISSKAFSTPPKPASASATIGANQSIESLPSA